MFWYITFFKMIILHQAYLIYIVHVKNCEDLHKSLLIILKLSGFILYIASGFYGFMLNIWNFFLNTVFLFIFNLNFFYFDFLAIVGFRKFKFPTFIHIH